MNGCNRAYLQSYINEFLWRQWNDVDRVEAYDSILQEIGNHYPTDTLKLINFEEEEDDAEISFTEWSEIDRKDGIWSQSRLINEEESESEEKKEESESESEEKEEESESESESEEKEGESESEEKEEESESEEKKLLVTNDESYKDLYLQYNKLKGIEKNLIEKVDTLNEKL
jgi:hypothetical protein